MSGPVPHRELSPCRVRLPRQCVSGFSLLVLTRRQLEPIPQTVERNKAGLVASSASRSPDSHRDQVTDRVRRGGRVSRNAAHLLRWWIGGSSDREPDAYREPGAHPDTDGARSDQNTRPVRESNRND